MTCRKIKYSSRTATTDDHADRHWSAMLPQVTAVDEQFGTHSRVADRIPRIVDFGFAVVSKRVTIPARTVP
jgi:hypothetical protein